MPKVMLIVSFSCVLKKYQNLLFGAWKSQLKTTKAQWTLKVDDWEKLLVPILVLCCQNRGGGAHTENNLKEPL